MDNGLDLDKLFGDKLIINTETPLFVVDSISNNKVNYKTTHDAECVHYHHDSQTKLQTPCHIEPWSFPVKNITKLKNEIATEINTTANDVIKNVILGEKTITTERFLVMVKEIKTDGYKFCFSDNGTNTLCGVVSSKKVRLIKVSAKDSELCRKKFDEFICSSCRAMVGYHIEGHSQVSL